MASGCAVQAMRVFSGCQRVLRLVWGFSAGGDGGAGVQGGSEVRERGGGCRVHS